jgi:hypothetical protein
MLNSCKSSFLFYFLPRYQSWPFAYSLNSEDINREEPVSRTDRGSDMGGLSHAFDRRYRGLMIRTHRRLSRSCVNENS